MSSDTESNDGGPEGMDRRSLLKRSALLGGALVWTTPVVQTIAQPAFAMGSDPGGGPICPPTAQFSFKHSRGLNSLLGDLTGACTLDSTAPVTQDSSLVSVVYTRAPAGPNNIPAQGAEGSQAVITLAPGYVLVAAQPKSDGQTDSGRNCTPPSTTNPRAGECSTGYTYTVTQTFLNGSNRRASIQYVTGEIRCAGCA